MGKAHDDARRSIARASVRSRMQTPFPSSDELLTEVFAATASGGEESAAQAEATGSRAVASRFSLSRARREAPAAVEAAAPPAASSEPEVPDVGPLLAEPGEIRWEGAIFERVTSIEQQLVEIEERLGKRIPELEERLLQLLEVRLLRFENELDSRLAGVSEHISRVGEGRRFWLGLSLAGTGLLVVLTLYVVFRLI